VPTRFRRSGVSRSIVLPATSSLLLSPRRMTTGPTPDEDGNRSPTEISSAAAILRSVSIEGLPRPRSSWLIRPLLTPALSASASIDSRPDRARLIAVPTEATCASLCDVVAPRPAMVLSRSPVWPGDPDDALLIDSAKFCHLSVPSDCKEGATQPWWSALA
jgi:hypothetical protein